MHVDLRAHQDLCLEAYASSMFTRRWSRNIERTHALGLSIFKLDNVPCPNVDFDNDQTIGSTSEQTICKEIP